MSDQNKKQDLIDGQYETGDKRKIDTVVDAAGTASSHQKELKNDKQ
ncbi:hypothetical protein V1498_09115 [Peribacillus sp. SCS-26]